MLSRGSTGYSSSTVVDIPVVVVQTAFGGVAAVAVHRQSSTFHLWRRGKFGVADLRENRRLSTGAVFSDFLRVSSSHR